MLIIPTTKQLSFKARAFDTDSLGIFSDFDENTTHHFCVRKLNFNNSGNNFESIFGL